MTPTQGNTPDPIYDERREQIKRAAMKVFARYGIAGTKMSMIAAEAGISQGLSYRYFSSKEELFTILVEEALEEAQTALRSTPQLPGGPKEQIRALTERMLDEEHKHNFMLLQQAQTSEDVPEQAKRILEQYSMQDASAGIGSRLRERAGGRRILRGGPLPSAASVLYRPYRPDAAGSSRRLAAGDGPLHENPGEISRRRAP
ncbi:TetR/AcrR family transcriptional regulator [Paenibacillus sp. P25]|nr:TetR/AcrR family transcriptional regulator [Paenibacillus sp. P25]